MTKASKKIKSEFHLSRKEILHTADRPIIVDCEEFGRNAICGYLVCILIATVGHYNHKMILLTTNVYFRLVLVVFIIFYKKILGICRMKNLQTPVRLKRRSLINNFRFGE